MARDGNGDGVQRYSHGWVPLNPELGVDDIIGDYRAHVTVSDAERDAIGTYAGAGYTAINGYLRGRGDFTLPLKSSPKASDLADTITGVMDRYELPGHTTVYRGDDGGAHLPSGINLTGKTLTMDGFFSTSMGDPAFGHRNVQMEIELPKGTRGIVPDALGVGVEGENEFILPHGSQFVVTSDTEDYRGVRELKMTLIPPDGETSTEPAATERAQDHTGEYDDGFYSPDSYGSGFGGVSLDDYDFS